MAERSNMLGTDVIIDAAVISDRDSFLDLTAELDNKHVGLDGFLYQSVKRNAEYFDSQMSNIYLAKRSGTVVGYINIEPMIEEAEDKIARIHKTLFIKAMVVGEEFKRLGIGTALMNFAKEKAKRESFGSIGLGVNVKNSEAVNFYQKQGFDSGISTMYYKVAFLGKRQMKDWPAIGQEKQDNESWPEWQKRVYDLRLKDAQYDGLDCEGFLRWFWMDDFQDYIQEAYDAFDATEAFEKMQAKAQRLGIKLTDINSWDWQDNFDEMYRERNESNR